MMIPGIRLKAADVLFFYRNANPTYSRERHGRVADNVPGIFISQNSMYTTVQTDTRVDKEIRLDQYNIYMVMGITSRTVTMMAINIAPNVFIEYFHISRPCLRNKFSCRRFGLRPGAKHRIVFIGYKMREAASSRR